MASSVASASWALPLQSRVAAAGPSCRVLLAVAPPRPAASMRRVMLLAPPRCSALEDPGAGGEENNNEEKKSVRKQARGRPVWRRILFASKKTRSIIILNALTVIYASDIPVLKEVEALTEPAVFNMVRFVVSAIPFLPFAIRAFGDRRIRNAGLELGLWVSLGYLAQAIGLLTSDAGRASFITAFTVIVVPLIDGIFGASIPKLTWFGAIVSLVGIGLLECGGSPPCVGDVLNFFSAVFFGIHMLRTEQISRSTDKKKFMALLSFEVLVVAFSSILWFLFKDSYVEVHDSSFESWTFGGSDSQGTLQLLKDARINQGALQLTPDSRNNDAYLVNKSGSVLLRQPFTLWRRLDDASPAPAAAPAASGSNGTGQAQRVRVVSFNSTFSMNVFYDKELPGEGLAFLIAPSLNGPPPGSDGGYLGLTNATLEENPAKNKFVAIEFDTFKQSYDPNNNHVGLDIGTIRSNKTTNLSDFNITIATNMTTAANYTVWIEYDGVARHISVYMTLKGKPKPASPVLDAPLDLSKHVPETSYLGFSASTGATFELNCILDWTLAIETFPEKKSKVWKILVAVAVPATVAVAIAAFFLIRRSRARQPMERRQERLEHKLSNLPGMPREFAYEKLRKATKNFDERLRLGKGGFGIVYKGLLPAEDGRPEAMEVAVKRFIRDDAKCVDDFVTEVDIINRLRHKNIVPLIGWCYKKGQLLLVYEYMPNGSLDQHLFRRGVHEQRPVLSWESRYGIVADAASGLHYVHHEYGRMVLHRDIKASNVLLDASFRARLGDFGLARVIEFDRNSFTDLGIAGTRGYIAPEYSVGYKATRQTDVFAFGALVLEAVTGRCALLGDPSCPLLSDWVWRLHGRGALLGAVDQNLGTDGFDNDDAKRLLLLGLACSTPNPGDRPTMPHVLQIVSKSAPPPEVPLFKPMFVWGEHFELSDIELTSGSYADTGNGTTAHATHDISYGSFQLPTAPNSTDDYFPTLSSGR